MSSFFPERNDPGYWLALRRVVARTKQLDRLPTLPVCEFMLMGATA